MYNFRWEKTKDTVPPVEEFSKNLEHGNKKKNHIIVYGDMVTL